MCDLESLEAVQEEIASCLLSADIDIPVLLNSMLQCKLTSKAELRILDCGMTHVQQVQYLLMQMFKRFQDAECLEKGLTLLSQHGVSSNLLDRVKRVRGIVSERCDTQVSHEAMILADGVSKDLAACTSTSSEERVVRCGTKRQGTSNFFTEYHVSDLTEILQDCVHKWREIGIALKLPSYVIECFYQESLARADICWYRVLLEWIRQNHVHARPPTLEALKDVLRSRCVGLGSVASDLEQKLNECGMELSSKQPLPAAKRFCLDTSAHQSFPEIAYENVKLSKWKKVLIDVYSAQPEVPADTWPPVASGTYINLALIKQTNMTDSDEFAHKTIQGDMDDIYKGKESIKYEKVFSDLRSGSRLLIQGRPGSGKTTLVHKVSRDWAKEQLTLGGSQLVFLVHLRYFLSDSKVTLDLHDLIKDHYSDQSTPKEIIKYAEEHSGEGLCFILDGLDEYTPQGQKQNTVIFKLIEKRILPRSIVIVASRPSGAAKVRKVATKQVETLGFLKDEIVEYIRKYNFSNSDKSEGLLSYLSDHPNVKHMCYLPIHTAMVCYLYDEMGSNLPRTETEMYKEFTNHTLLRTLYRGEFESIIESAEDLPDKEKGMFAQICELAFELTKLSRQVMKGKEIKFFNKVSSDNDSLGLITVDSLAKKYGKESLYTFLHLTFQEYLAAYHIAHLEEEQQQRIIKKHGKKKNMQVVWKFYCGLVDHTEDTSKFAQLMKLARDDLFRVQCAYESQQAVACDCVVKAGKPNQLSLQSHFLNPVDFTAIGYVLSKSKHPVKELVFNRCDFGQDGTGIDALLKEAGERIHLIKTLTYGGGNCSKLQLRVANHLLRNIPELEIFNVADTRLGPEKVKDLTNGLSLRGLRRLKLSENHFDRRILSALSATCGNKFLLITTSADLINYKTLIDEVFGKQVFFNSMCQSSRMDLTSFSLDFHDVQLLSASMVEFSHCTKLILTNCGINDESAKVLGALIQRLHVFNVSFNAITDDGAKVLAQQLNHCTHLQLLDISCNEIGDEGVIAIAKATNCKHTKSHLWNYAITSNGMQALQHILGGSAQYYGSAEVSDNEMLSFHSYVDKYSDHCSNLLTLNVKVTSTNNMKLVSKTLRCCQWLQRLHCYLRVGVEGTKALAESLRHCNKLQQLHLDSNNIGNEGAKALAENLKHCNNLQQLHLDSNNIGDEGAKALAENLKHCNNLQQLHLDSNNIGNEGAKALAENLKHCNNLQQLHLDSNNIGDEGAKALAENLKHCNNLQQLHLESNNIGDEGAKALADNLKYCNNLQQLHLESNNIGDEGAKALADNLKYCNNLQQLHLESNKIGAEGAKALADNLKYCNNLQQLHLESNKIGAEGAKALADNLKHCNNLQQLHLRRNNIGDEGAKALADNLKHCNNLQQLHLESNNIGDEGAKALADNLKYCNNLQQLHLESNNIGAEGAKALADNLKYCNNLQQLHLESNKIGAEGAKALADNLKYCNNLQQLHLESNKIGAEGAKALADNLKYCNNLQQLHLESNKIGAEGAKALADNLKHCNNLQQLHLESNNIGDEGAKALADNLKHCNNLQQLHLESNKIGAEGAKALADNLKHCNNLQQLHLGWNNIGDEGAKALADNLKHCNNLQQLHLESNNIGNEGAKALADNLKHCNNLQQLYLGWNNIGDEGAKALADNLKHCNNLQQLHLESNNIGDEGAKALADNLKHCNNLQQLHLVSNKIGAEGAKALADNLKHCNNLQQLHLESNNIGAEGAKALADNLKYCNNLQQLHLESNKIGAEGAKALADNLKHCNNLQQLHLESNKIGAEGAKALADNLKHCNNLQQLHLESNNIGAEGAKALADNLKHCNNLQQLHLGWNNIGDEGAKALADNLKHCNNLQQLHLDHDNIGYEGAKAFADNLKHCNNLQQLHLKSNYIGDEGAKALADNLKHCNNLQQLHLGWNNNIGAEGAKALADNLKHCNNLQQLHLESNNIGNEGAKALADNLKHCNNLQQLYLGWNNIGDEGAKALADNLKHCNNLQQLHLESNNIGDEGAKALADNLKHAL